MKTSRQEKSWFEQEAFWECFYPFMFPEARWIRAPEEAQQVLALAGNPAGGELLDLCCGPGRHSLEFARLGFRVTGVDRTRLLLDRARRFCEQAGQTVEWVESDMREFRREESFDVAINLFTSFGYFEDEAENLAVLDNLLASLKPGGVLVMELAGKEWLARHFSETTSSQAEDGTLTIERHKIIDDWTRIENEWIILRGSEAQRFRFAHWLYSGKELKDMLRRVGFAQVTLYGGLGGGPYGREAHRLVAVAVKD